MLCCRFHRWQHDGTVSSAEYAAYYPSSSARSHLFRHPLGSVAAHSWVADVRLLGALSFGAVRLQVSSRELSRLIWAR